MLKSQEDLYELIPLDSEKEEIEAAARVLVNKNDDGGFVLLTPEGGSATQQVVAGKKLLVSPPNSKFVTFEHCTVMVPAESHSRERLAFFQKMWARALANPEGESTKNPLIVCPPGTTFCKLVRVDEKDKSEDNKIEENPI